MKTKLRQLAASLLKPNKKAIAGAISGSLTGFFTNVGVTLDADAETAVATLVGFTLGLLIVWVSPANEPKED